MHPLKILLPLLLLSLILPISASTPYIYEYQDLDGATKSLSSYEGDYLVVELFSTECSHCIDYHPILAEVYADFSDEITLVSLSVNTEDTFDDISTFIEAHPTNWTIGKTESDLPSAYIIRGTPTTLLFSPEGDLQACLEGTQTADALSNHLTSYLEDSEYTDNVDEGSCPSPSFINQFFNSIFFPIALVALIYGVIYLRKNRV